MTSWNHVLTCARQSRLRPAPASHRKQTVYAYRSTSSVHLYSRTCRALGRSTPLSFGMAALTVIDRDGLDALSMRAVAAELDVGTMSLYRYIIDRRLWNA
jgi:hypothetical protein